MSGDIIMVLLVKHSFSRVLPATRPMPRQQQRHRRFARRSERFRCGGMTGEAPRDAQPSQGTPASQQTPVARQGGQRVTELEPCRCSGAYSPQLGSCSGGC